MNCLEYLKTLASNVKSKEKHKKTQPSFAVLSIFSITNFTPTSQNIHFNHDLLGKELPASLLAYEKVK